MRWIVLALLLSGCACVDAVTPAYNVSVCTMMKDYKDIEVEYNGITVKVRESNADSVDALVETIISRIGL